MFGPTRLLRLLNKAPFKIPDVGFGEIFVFACEECDVIPEVFVEMPFYSVSY